MKPNMQLGRVILWALVYVAIGVFIVGTVVIAINTYTTAAAIRKTQTQNTSTLNFAKESLRVLKDCTEPKGKCYQEGQKAQGQAIGTLTASQVAAVACADGPDTQSFAEIQACVARTLAALE